jgi:NTP pyrophosphatase (non-canonical NTP hydrolase)
MTHTGFLTPFEREQDARVATLIRAREQVFTLVGMERERQCEKWDTYRLGWQDSNEIKLAVLMEEVGEVARAILEGKELTLQEELIQVAAVAIAWLEWNIMREDPS